MTPHPDSDAARRQVYGLLILLTLGLTLGRVMSAERVNEPSVHKSDTDSVTPRPAWPKARPEPWPTFSSNDRSRWAAVRALVEQGTFVIGTRDKALAELGAPTTLAAGDAVQAVILLELGYRMRIKSDKGIIFDDGWQSVDKMMRPDTFEYYSTKPPLLTFLAAGGYYALRNGVGLDIVRDRWLVVGTIVVLLNVLPLWLYLWILSKLADRLSTDDWTRFFIVGAAGFATLMTPFLIALNNHTPATVAVAVIIFAVVRVREGGGAGWYALAGLSSGFLACNELPALSFAAAIGFYLLLHSPTRTLLAFVPAALLPVAVMLGGNYVQLGSFDLGYTRFGGPWYEYEGSHWRVAPGTVKRGIDFARRNGLETPSQYAFHLLVGHHGWFSLMPINLLGLAGMLAWVAKYRPGSQDEGPRIAACALAVSAVVIGYYLYKSDNYGGWSNGPRWLMWLTPLWLVCMIPALEALSRSRLGRAFAGVLLAFSIMSMTFQMWNPARHPWIYNWMESRGMIPY